ncbi:MAG: hypothetical protein WA826_03530 [Silvibacterium sp.]
MVILPQARSICPSSSSVSIQKHDEEIQRERISVGFRWGALRLGCIARAIRIKDYRTELLKAGFDIGQRLGVLRLARRTFT